MNRSDGKRHKAAVMCMARRSCNVIFAMLTRGEFFGRLPLTSRREDCHCLITKPNPHRILVWRSTEMRKNTYARMYDRPHPRQVTTPEKSRSRELKTT